MISPMILTLAAGTNMRQRTISRTPTSLFGEWLRMVRAERGFTMEMLAERADTAAPVISNLERGIRNPSTDMVRRLAAALCPPDADEHVAQALLNAGLKAAFPRPQDNSDGELETMVSRAGYSPDDFDDDARARLRQNIDAVIIGIAEQEKQKKQNEGRQQ